MLKEIICKICGRAHKGAGLCVSVLAANGNFAPVSEQAPRRRLSVAESVARNKVRYAKTLERLT